MCFILRGAAGQMTHNVSQFNKYQFSITIQSVRTLWRDCPGYILLLLSASLLSDIFSIVAFCLDNDSQHLSFSLVDRCAAWTLSNSPTLAHLQALI